MEQAVDVLDHAALMNVKISQITFYYPTFSMFDYLGQLNKMPSGNRFNLIKTFKPSSVYHFTLKPSVFSTVFIFKQILG